MPFSSSAASRPCSSDCQSEQQSERKARTSSCCHWLGRSRSRPSQCDRAKTIRPSHPSRSPNHLRATSLNKPCSPESPTQTVVARQRSRNPEDNKAPRSARAPHTQLGERKKKKTPTHVAGLVSSAEVPKTPRRNLGDHPTTIEYIRHKNSFVNKIPYFSKIILTPQ